MKISFLLQGIMKNGPVTLTVTASASSVTMRAGVRKTQEEAGDSSEQASVSSSRGDHNKHSHIFYIHIYILLSIFLENHYKIFHAFIRKIMMELSCLDPVLQCFE